MLGCPVCANIFDFDLIEEKIQELEAKSSDPDFWDDPESAQSQLRELSEAKSVRDDWNKVNALGEDADLYLEIIAAGDQEAEELLDAVMQELAEKLDKFELASLLQWDYDQYSAILSIHAGTGGDDAQDWANMLLRMYSRWAEAQGYKVTLSEISPGDHGIHSATLFIEGSKAFGFLRSESGVHRLVRISPFDSANRRHTSFAAVDVVPDIADAIEVEINPDDLRVDTFRASGAGGQHVNKTDSAIRLTHIPTGIVVACQNERSQHANKDSAMRVLRAKLFELEQSKRDEKLATIRGESNEIAWGYQIRNYVQHPYSQVKDRRTGVETSQVQKVLDGALDTFIRGYLEACVYLGREPKPGENIELPSHS